MDLAALQQLPLPEFLQQLYHRQLKTTVADSAWIFFFCFVS